MRKKKTFNPWDERYKEMWYAISEYKADLYYKAQQVIVTSGVVGLYPNGPDQSAAIREREAQKAALLNCIGHYDTMLMELKDYYKKTYDNLDECKTWNPDRFITSHRVIESAYKDFYHY